METMRYQNGITTNKLWIPGKKQTEIMELDITITELKILLE